MEEEKENLESTLGWGTNELPSDIHNVLGCLLCHVGEDGTWVYCPQSLFHPFHLSHLCPPSQGCYCKQQLNIIYFICFKWDKFEFL